MIREWDCLLNRKHISFLFNPHTQTACISRPPSPPPYPRVLISKAGEADIHIALTVREKRAGGSTDLSSFTHKSLGNLFLLFRLHSSYSRRREHMEHTMSTQCTSMRIAGSNGEKDPGSRMTQTSGTRCTACGHTQRLRINRQSRVRGMRVTCSRCAASPASLSSRSVDRTSSSEAETRRHHL